MSLAQVWLRRQWCQFVPAMLAVAFSCLMLLVLAALVLGIFGSAAVYVNASSGQLWAGSAGTQSINFGQPLDVDVESRLAAHPNVAVVEPYYWVEGNWRNRAGAGRALSVFVSGIAVQARGLMFSSLLTSDMREALRAPGAVIVDTSDLNALGVGVGGLAWINGVPVTVVDTVPGLRGLGGVNAIASVATARDLRTDADEADRPTYVVASLVDSSKAEVTRKDLSQQVGWGHYEVWSASELARRSQNYWLFETGAGVAVSFMAVIVCLVGVVVAGYAQIAVVMRATQEFAVLIALGVSPWKLCRVVMAQAAWIGGIGIGVGGLMAAVLLSIAATHDVPVGMTAPIAVGCALLILMLTMCAGLFSILSVLRANPVTLLR